MIVTTNVTLRQRPSTHVSVLVEVVVGELELVEEHGLLHPVGARGRGVRVDVETARHVGLGLPRHHPLRVVVLVAAVVQRHDVHQQDVLGVRVEAFQRHLESGEHPSENAGRLNEWGAVVAR